MKILSEKKDDFDPGSPPGVLLANLGTPDAPTTQSVRRYLAEFLSDPRVVEIPRLVWWPILYGAVLTTRPRQSAEKYARIWTREGSPLRVHTESQSRLVAGYLGERLGRAIRVEFAMRYGTPGIEQQLARMKEYGITRILIVPLYPQYSASATASVFDAVATFIRRTRDVPEIRLVRDFHAHPAYIESLSALVREHWRRDGRTGKLLMSFHGLPQRSVEKGDPYSAQCGITARLLAKALELTDGQWQMSFQSRFGAAKWLQPYTASTLETLARSGTSRVAVICPGFVSDCLETLEEIGIEAQEIFLRAGGTEFSALPCLNERDDWIRALCAIIETNLQGWIASSGH